jgi:predicted Zn-dependent protease
MEQKLYIYRSKKKNSMDIQAEIKWIQNALSESKDPTFVEAVKGMIKSMKKVKETLSSEQMHEDALMAEAEADIKAGRAYNIEEAHKIADSWEL